MSKEPDSENKLVQKAAELVCCYKHTVDEIESYEEAGKRLQETRARQVNKAKEVRKGFDDTERSAIVFGSGFVVLYDDDSNRVLIFPPDEVIKA